MEIRDHKYYQNLNKSIWRDENSWEFWFSFAAFIFFAASTIGVWREYLYPNFKNDNIVGFIILAFFTTLFSISAIFQFRKLKKGRGEK